MCVQFSERVAWSLDDVFPAGTRFDFNKPFLPESLAPTAGYSFLSDADKLKLSQIRGYSYLHIFYFVEEYIIPTAIKHATGAMFGSQDEMRSLLRFADEEVKHQQLFARAKATFEESFGSPCGLLESAQEVAGQILSEPQLAVLLITLQFELITQQHFVEHVQSAAELDGIFRSMLKHHWQEEAQHAKIDALELEKIASGASAAQLLSAFDSYKNLVRGFATILNQQAALDVESLSRARSAPLTESERVELLRGQSQSLRRSFLELGLEHPAFIARVAELFPSRGMAELHALSQEISQ